MNLPLPPCHESASWRDLARHAQAHFQDREGGFDVRSALANDPRRVAAFSLQAPEVFADWSKHRIDPLASDLLLQLAGERQLPGHRDALFAGEPINSTEKRAVMHWLLRTPRDVTPPVHLRAAHADVHQTLDAMLAFAERIRSDPQITDVVNIGIGGSDLGPQMAVLALNEFAHRGKRMHFVSNVDGHEINAVLRGLEPRHTLFLIASKTFTTIETMTNAATARAWFLKAGGRGAQARIGRHFAALTTNVAAAASFGIDTCFGFWDWVGGRYSMWSAIGLPIAIAAGAAAFRDLLAGAHAMDLHFARAPLANNLPVRLGLLDVWNRNFLQFSQRNIAPYHSHLRRLPAYLQQLEMESNGKGVDAQGRSLAVGSSPALWGEPGTNGQHAFFQMLHQGTDVVPVEFVVVRNPSHALADHHPLLLANAIAQAQALLQGQSDAGGHRRFTGNRPSTFFVLDALTPRSLGAFIAMYEHRVFTSGSIWGINSFDQFGVELGKVLAKDVVLALSGAGDIATADASTQALMQRLRSGGAG